MVGHTRQGWPPSGRAAAQEVRVSWWWCLNHSRPEQDPDVDAGAADRLGPYETEEAAKNWRQQFAERNEQWDKWDQEDKEGRK
jgi:hypothetical protein